MADILGKLPKTFGGDTNTRTTLFNTTKTASTGAEWEVYYNGYWRDVSDDFQWDVTKDGNTILRAIRWDNGGFRSYRDDRGLILRRKTDDEEQKQAQQQIDYSNFFSNAAKAFGVSLSAGLIVRNIPQLRPVFAVAGIIGLGFQSIEIVQSIVRGESAENILLKTAGSLAGSSLGGAAASKVFGTAQTIVTPIKKSEPVYGISEEALMQAKGMRHDIIAITNTQAAYSVRGTGETGRTPLNMPLKVAGNVKRNAKSILEALNNLSITGEGD
jgi:hypothetical protein